MHPSRAVPLLAILLLVSPLPSACAGDGDPPPPPAAEGAEAEARRRADDASLRARRLREEAAAAEREAAAADLEALRARRRDLEERIRTAEDALATARADGATPSVVDGAAARLRALYEESAGISARLAGGGAAPVVAVGAAGVPRAPARLAVPFDGTAGLGPLQPRADAAAAVEEGLDWLARHQAPDGSWDCDGFDARCDGGRCPGTGGPLYDVGVTGLSVTAFLGAGETHTTVRHGPTVRGALKYLKGVQDAEGCFGARTSSHFTYGHALATLAMAEAYALTSSPLFEKSAQEGANFILRAQNPYAGWRYGVRPGDSDASVTGWMVLALQSARAGGLAVDPAAFQGAVAFLDRVTDPATGRVGYTMRGNGPARPMDVVDRFPQDRSEALTAEGVLVRRFSSSGDASSDALVRRGTALCLERLPAWDPAAGGTDFVYWYFGTLATRLEGGDGWRRWREARDREWSRMQRGPADGCARGSWDPVDAWGSEGGRVYATALSVMGAAVREPAHGPAGPR